MAADTFTALLGLLKQGTGNNNNTWGALLNSGDFDEVDLAIAGRNPQTITGGTLDLSGSPPPAGPSAAIHAILDLTGTLTGNQIVKVPNLSKLWIVRNGTTGAFTVSFETPSGSPVVIPQGGWTWVWCDGNNTIYVGISTTWRDIQALFADGSSDTIPGIAFASETNTGFRRKGTNDVALVIGGVEIMEFTGAGAGVPNIVNVLSPAVLQNQGGAIATGPGASVTGDFAIFTDAAGQKLSDAGTRLITQSLLAAGAAPLPAVFTQVNDNLHVANDGTNPTRDINVTNGRVRSDDDSTNIQINATLIKRLDTGFVSGTNAGACDTGSKGASQTWHIYAIGKLSLQPTQYSRTSNVTTLTFGSAHGLAAGATIRVINVAAGFDGLATIASAGSTTLTYANTGGNVGTTAAPAAAIVDAFDVLASQSYPSPSMPSGWTVKQCLGSVLTDGSSNIIAFTQVGDVFQLVTRTNSTATAGSSSRTLFTLTVPTGVKVFAEISYFIPNPSDNVIITSPDQADTAPSSTGSGLDGTSVVAASSQSAAWKLVRTNTSAQIGVRDSLNASIGIFTSGWRDPRRRMF